jgi:hypothetical protein
MTKITCEIYVEDIWIEFEIQTANPETVLQNLIKSPARNIKVY